MRKGRTEKNEESKETKGKKPPSRRLIVSLVPFSLSSLSVLSSLSILLCVALPACDDTTIDPFNNEGRFYTIWGFLETSFENTEQAVRVVPVTRFPERITDPLEPQAEIDAVVTSTDLATGRAVRWDHHLERLDDGTYGHVFRADFFVEAGHTYRLEVERSDGTTAWAETTVPATFTIRPERATPRVAPDGDVVQDVLLPGVTSPWDLQVRYCVGGSFSCTQMPLAYGRVGERTDAGWRFTINITDDQSRLSALLGQPASAFQFAAMGLDVRILDKQWAPPGDVFDPEVLAQPGRLSNVENGYGFFGAIGVLQDDWPISQDLRDLLGFTPQ